MTAMPIDILVLFYDNIFENRVSRRIFGPKREEDGS
jgi:hypothetical protein